MAASDKELNEVFANDTIKNYPQFFDYMFVYVPAKSRNFDNTFNCITPLTSLLTQNYKYGKSNLFLYVYDNSITSELVDQYSMRNLFKQIRLSVDDITQTAKKITADFKEDISSYETEIPEMEDDKFATYYIEEDEDSDNVATVEQAKKTYFGPPSTRNYTLTGIIRDKTTGEALPYAAIIIKGNKSGTTTNAEGFFSLLKVPTDTSVLIVQYVGYNTTEIYLNPQMPKKNLVITLRPVTQMLKTVNVVGHKDIVISARSDVSTVKMTPKKLETLPNLGERDIMRSMQLLPGVTASMESSSGLYVRGGTPDQNLVLFDGFTVYYVDHLYGFYSAFNTNAIKDFQLYKGGYEAKFGGRLSSVTEITGKEGNQNKFNMGVDISLLSLNGFIEIPIKKKFTSVITYRRSYKGLLYNKIFDKLNGNSTKKETNETGMRRGPTQNTQINSFFYDLNGKFSYHLSDNDILSLSVYNGTDKLDNSSSMDMPNMGSSSSSTFNSSSTDYTKYGNVGSSLKWYKKWNDKLYGNHLLTYSNYFSSRERSQERTITDSSGESSTSKSGVFENNDLYDFSFKTDYQWEILKHCQLQFGSFLSNIKIAYDYAQSDTASLLNKNDQGVLAGGYLQTKIKFLNEKLVFLPGVRTTYFDPTGKLYYEPRFSMSYNVFGNITLKAATGKYYQFVNKVTREDIMSGSKEFWLLADGSSLPISSANHYILGLNYENNNYLFSAEMYHKDIFNLTEYSLRFNPSPTGTNFSENFYTGHGYADGIEFMAQKKSGKFNGWINYTIGEAKNYFDVYSDKYFPANQDVTHEFKIVAMYQHKRWDFSATWIFATGRPYTAPSGAYTVTLLDGTTQEYYTVTSKNSLHMPNYHRADIAVNYKLLAGNKEDRKRKEIGSVGFSIFNLYNRKNVWYKTFYIYDGSIYETNVNYMTLMPNITLTLKLR